MLGPSLNVGSTGVGRSRVDLEELAALLGLLGQSFSLLSALVCRACGRFSGLSPRLRHLKILDEAADAALRLMSPGFRRLRALLMGSAQLLGLIRRFSARRVHSSTARAAAAADFARASASVTFWLACCIYACALRTTSLAR